MRFKSIFVWLLIFIVGSLIVSFLIYPSIFQSFKQSITSKISGNAISSLPSNNNSNPSENLKIKTFDNDYCKENIIPEYLLVWTKYTDNHISEQIITSDWKDGTEIVSPKYYGNLNLICKIGSRTGENINYRYCNGLSYYNPIQKISDTGEIQEYEKNNYAINLTIEKDSYKKEQLQGGYFLYYNIIDYECNKI
jgi:hypothetical protein